jgi:hypothetical protein
MLSKSLEPVKDLFELEFIDSTGDNIEEACAKKAAIFHYSGHTDADNGRGYLLKTVSETNEPSCKLYSDILAAMLQKSGARLAVFNACNSGRWAFISPLAEMGLPAIIGVYGTVSTEASIAFCEKLYSSLAIGLSLDEAVTWARLHVLEMEQSKGRQCFEWGSFMVYMITKNAVIIPRPKNQALMDRQDNALQERSNMIFNVKQIIYGSQTNIGGSVSGPVLSGSFDGSVSIGKDGGN